MIVEQVFEYRTLQGKCELGLGLDWDEIDRLTAIEDRFAPGVSDRGGRRFRREQVVMAGTLRGDRINDRIDIIELSPGGMVVRNAPYVARGEIVEIVVDMGDASYRFAAEGVWMRDDGDDYRIGLVFRGMPVCVRKAAISSHAQDATDMVGDLVKRAA